MEEPEQLIRRVLELASADEGIWAVIQTGSRARGDRVDAFSDLDLELIGPAAPGLAGQDGWLEPLGPRLVTLHLANDEPDWPTCLVVLAGGRKIDFTLAGPSRITDLATDGLDELYQRGYAVLLDTVGITADLPPAPFAKPDATLPDADDFDAHQREFWFEATQVPTYVARGDLWPAATREGDMRALLLQMLEWNTTARHHGAVDVWHNGHHLHEWLSQPYLSRLGATQARYDAPGLTSALHALIDLYAEVTTDTARRFDLPEQGLRRRVLDHVNGVLAHVRPTFQAALASADGADVVAPGKSAAPVQCLIVVDMQVGFVDGPDAAPGAEELITAVDELLTRARDTGAMVVHLRNAGPVGALDEPGTATWELNREPAPGELLIDKVLDDGFVDTALARELERRRADRLAICGVMSQMCVAATTRGALDRGYGVVLPHPAHGTYDVPPGPGGSSAIPAALAARAAEWSLGDEVEIVATPASISFTAVSS